MTLTALSCPSCAAPLPDITARRVEHVVCEYCDHKLEVDKALKSLGRVQQTKPKNSPLSLGDAGTLFGIQQTIIAIMRYRTGNEYWLEYALHSPTHGYSFLSYDADGNWTLSRRNRDIDADGPLADFDGKTFVRDERYMAQLDYVAGQLTWQAELGDATRCDEYLRDGETIKLVRERSNNEDEWFVEQFVSVAVVERAFSTRLHAATSLHSLDIYQPSRGLAALSRFGWYGFMLCCLVTFVLELSGDKALGYQGGMTFPNSHVVPFKPSRVTEIRLTGHVRNIVQSCQMGVYKDQQKVLDLNALLQKQVWSGTLMHKVSVTEKFAAPGAMHVLLIDNCSKAVAPTSKISVHFFGAVWSTRYVFYMGVFFLLFPFVVFWRRTIHQNGGSN